MLLVLTSALTNYDRATRSYLYTALDTLTANIICYVMVLKQSARNTGQRENDPSKTSRLTVDFIKKTERL